MRSLTRGAVVSAVLGMLAYGLTGIAPAGANGVALNKGDVLAGVGGGMISHFNSNGTKLDSLNTTVSGTEDTGMCFDASKNLYVTDFEANHMSKFNGSGNLVSANFGTGFNAHPESCAFNAAGAMYVGQADGSANILKFSSTGTLLATYTPTTATRGTDWIDLAANQCTIHYTGEGSLVKAFNVCTNRQLPDFASGLPAPCFAHRILSNGGELVACASEVVLLNASGQIAKTYTPDPNHGLFALNLDPDGTTFWTANISDGHIWRVNIATGAVVKTFTAAITQSLAGLAVVGEITAGRPPQTLGNGMMLLGGDGGMFAYGNRQFVSAADFLGLPGPLTTPLGQVITTPFVGIASTPTRAGYWDVTGNGQLFAIGDAPNKGGLTGLHLASPISGIAGTHDGKGYWMVGRDGGVFTFGDAVFHGSLGNVHLAAPIVGIVATASGNGYWLFGADGGVFTFGDAVFHGSLGNVHLAGPIVDMVATHDGGGYLMAGSDGGAFAFGDSPFFGSNAGVRLAKPVVSINFTADGLGYWEVGGDGGIFTHGDAPLEITTFHGVSAPLTKLAPVLRAPIVGAVS